MSTRFDAYTATIEEAKHEDVAQLVFDVVGFGNSFDGMVQWRPGKGYHRFGERLAAVQDGKELAAVSWGGGHQDLVMLEVKGEHTPRVVKRLRARFPHRCTRVDSCADWDAPGAFERLYRACRPIKKAHRIVGGKAGDWEDFPEKGRTLYLGSKSSVSRVRLYEKGLQPEYQHLGRADWVRLEVQVRPEKEARYHFSKLDPLQVWGASRWTRDLAGAVLQEHVDPHPAGTTYRLSERQSALRWMCRQYGPHLIGLADDLGGWDCLGLTLREMIEEVKRR